MLHKALLALVLGATLVLGVSTAQADLDLGQLVEIQGAAIGGGLPGTNWGSLPAGVPDHPFGGQTVYIDQVYGPNFTVTVRSGQLLPPPGKKFKGFVEVDFGAFAPGAFLFHSFVFGPIKEMGGDNFINTVTLVHGPGQAVTDGASIAWSGFGAALAANPIVEIEWTQIPAPGSFALLGMAGLVGNRRRRR